MHLNVSKEPHFEAKKDLRTHPTLHKRANPNLGIAVLNIHITLLIHVCFIRYQCVNFDHCLFYHKQNLIIDKY